MGRIVLAGIGGEAAPAIASRWSLSMSFQALRAPAQTYVGPGTVGLVGGAARHLGARALICTDTGVAQSPALARVLDTLKRAGIESSVFEGAKPELPLASVADSVSFASRQKFDFVVGLGGGSSIDLAKLTALLTTYPGDIQSFYGEAKVPGPVRPVVAIPTTAGTGSEVTPVAVVDDPDRELKVGVSSVYLIPRLAICDAELTYSCPPSVTAFAGIDALVHAIEAFTAKSQVSEPGELSSHVFIGKNDLSDQFALAAIARIARALPAAVASGDHKARNEMAYGSLLAGLAFGVAGTALAHALQYPVGAMTKTPHGLGTGLLLPFVMLFTLPSSKRELAQIGVTMGVAEATDDEGEAAAHAVVAVRSLALEVGVPSSLRDLGIEKTDLQKLASQTTQVARLVRLSPRAAGEQELLTILEAAMSGSIEPIEGTVGVTE